MEIKKFLKSVIVWIFAFIGLPTLFFLWYRYIAYTSSIPSLTEYLQASNQSLIVCFSFGFLLLFIYQIYIYYKIKESIVRKCIKKKENLRLAKEIVKDSLIAFTTTYTIIMFSSTSWSLFLVTTLIEVNLIFLFYTFFIKNK